MCDQFNISIVSYTKDTSDLHMCLDSLKNQHVMKNVIIVDNLGSLAIKTLSSKYEFVQYFQLPNVGFGAGHNFASSKFSQGGYRVFLNPDICLPDQCLNIIKNCFKKNSGVSLLSPILLNLDGSYQQFVRDYPGLPSMLKRIFFNKNSQPDYTLKDKMFVDTKYMHGAFFVIDKGISTHQSMFDERYFLYLEDIDLCISMADYGRVGVCLDAKVFHRHGKASRKLSRITWIHFISFVKFWLKHGILYRRIKSNDR